MLSVIALCAVAHDWYDLRRSYLGYDLGLGPNYSGSLLSAAEGDEDAAMTALTVAEQTVMAMDYEDLKATVQKCQEDFDHLK